MQFTKKDQANRNLPNNRLVALEQEKTKLWEKIAFLEDEILKKATDYEKSAKQASKMSSQYRNKSESTNNTISNYLNDVVKSSEIIFDHQKEVQKYYEETTEKAHKITSINDMLGETNNSVMEKIDNINEAFSDSEELKGKIDAIAELSDKAIETSSKIDLIHNGLLKRKKDVDQIHIEVVGYSVTDGNSGEITKVEGLKDKLETSYDFLKEKATSVEVGLEDLQSQAEKNYENYIEEKDNSLGSMEESWGEKYEKIIAKIERLLPNALTAGLSHAYSVKKTDEENESKELSQKFTRSIRVMMGISLIPFAVMTRGQVLN